MSMLTSGNTCKNRTETLEWHITPYTPADRDAFEQLNRWWVEKYFSVEPTDMVLFAEPERLIIEPGGAIFMARLHDESVGACALMRMSKEPGKVYELLKMGVAETMQGKGIGRGLLLHALADAGSRGADKVIIYSNTLLTSAITLYRSVGFVEAPLSKADRKRYQRVNIKLHYLFPWNSA